MDYPNSTFPKLCTQPIIIPLDIECKYHFDTYVSDIVFPVSEGDVGIVPVAPASPPMEGEVEEEEGIQEIYNKDNGDDNPQVELDLAEDELYNYIEDDGDDDENQQKEKKPKVMTGRKQWSASEEKEIELLFKKHIATGKCPSLKDCQLAVDISKANNGTIHARSLQSVKTKVNNMQIKKRKTGDYQQKQ